MTLSHEINFTGGGPQIVPLYTLCVSTPISDMISLISEKFFWDLMKLPNRHWLTANMATEAFLGFNAFNTRKLTGEDTIDFVKYRQLIAEGAPMDEEAFAAVLGEPKKE